MSFNPQQLQKMLTSAGAPLIGGAAVLGGLVYGVNNCMYNVDAGHRAIKFSRFGGLGKTHYEEGTHLMVPWVERPIIFDTRTRPRTIVSLTGSRDLQMVNISVQKVLVS